MNYVADTHSLVWYFAEDPRLGMRALQAFEETIQEGSVIILVVVLAELMFIAQKGRIGLTFAETLEKIEALDNFQIVPLGIAILRTASQLGMEMEMHDQLIVATAVQYQAVLITKDDRIAESGIVPTIW